MERGSKVLGQRIWLPGDSGRGTEQLICWLENSSPKINAYQLNDDDHNMRTSNKSHACDAHVDFFLGFAWLLDYVALVVLGSWVAFAWLRVI